jgi:Dolichyl-phosphate-mannose-protein mannosyltransferase
MTSSVLRAHRLWPHDRLGDIVRGHWGISMWASIQERWRTYNPYLAALAIFGTSRLVVVWAIYMAARIVVLPSHIPSTSLPDPSTAWYHYLLRWDSGWYASILKEGYKYNGNDLVEQSVVFYPLYPLIAKAITILTGIDGLLALLVVANVSAVISMFMLFKYVRQDHGDEVALLTIALLSFFPTSFFLSAGYSESLALLLILCCFTLLKREQFIFAAAFAGLASATRATGLVLLPVIIWELWCKFASDRRRFLSYALFCSILAMSGLWFYMFYLWSVFDSPFAFVTDRAAWETGEGGIGRNFISALLLKGFFPLGLSPHNLYPRDFDIWFFLLFLTLILVYRKWLPSSLHLFALGVLMLPYLTGTGGSYKFASMTRYILLAFPVFVVMAKLCKNRLWLVPCITGLFAAMLFGYSALYAQWYWVG